MSLGNGYKADVDDEMFRLSNKHNIHWMIAHRYALAKICKNSFIELREDYLKKNNYPTNDKELNKRLRIRATDYATNVLFNCYNSGMIELL